jgi:hypothetical protein
LRRASLSRPAEPHRLWDRAPDRRVRDHGSEQHERRADGAHERQARPARAQRMQETAAATTLSPSAGAAQEGRRKDRLRPPTHRHRRRCWRRPRRRPTRRRVRLPGQNGVVVRSCLVGRRQHGRRFRQPNVLAAQRWRVHRTRSPRPCPHGTAIYPWRDTNAPNVNPSPVRVTWGAGWRSTAEARAQPSGRQGSCSACCADSSAGCS